MFFFFFFQLRNEPSGFRTLFNRKRSAVHSNGRLLSCRFDASLLAISSSFLLTRCMRPESCCRLPLRNEKLAWKEIEWVVSSMPAFECVSFSDFNPYSAFAGSSCCLYDIPLKMWKGRARISPGVSFLKLDTETFVSLSMSVQIYMQSFLTPFLFLFFSCSLINWTFIALWWLIRKKSCSGEVFRVRPSIAWSPCSEFRALKSSVYSLQWSPHYGVLPGKFSWCSLRCEVFDVKYSLWNSQHNVLTLKPSLCGCRRKVLAIKSWLWILHDEVSLMKTLLRSLIKGIKDFSFHSSVRSEITAWPFWFPVTKTVRNAGHE